MLARREVERRLAETPQQTITRAKAAILRRELAVLMAEDQAATPNPNAWFDTAQSELSADHSLAWFDR
jgi:hypothetical protein